MATVGGPAALHMASLLFRTAPAQAQQAKAGAHRPGKARPTACGTPQNRPRRVSVAFRGSPYQLPPPGVPMVA